MMDALKQKFGEQNPEERDRRKKQLIGINFFQLALCLTMVIIGVQYNDLEDCRSGDAPKYLLLGRVLIIMSSATCVAAIFFLDLFDDANRFTESKYFKKWKISENIQFFWPFFLLSSSCDNFTQEFKAKIVI